MTEGLINGILAEMSSELTDEQLHKLESILVMKLHGLKIEEECTEITVSEASWQRILRLYIASKRLENCAESTLENYERCIRMLMCAINKNLPDITTNDLRYYLAVYQKTRHISMSYLETLRHYISAFFTWCADEGYISGNPARRLKRVKVPQKIRKPYTAEEREHLKDIAKTQRDLAIMELLYSTAGRIGEVVAINRDDIDFANKEIVIWGQKGKKERTVYLTDGCIYHLRKYLDSRTDGNPALFVSLKRPHNRIGKNGIETMLRKLGLTAGIHAHPHKFRRTMLTDAGARGVPLQEIQAYAGHAKTDTTMLYITTKEESVKASFMRCIA